MKKQYSTTHPLEHLHKKVLLLLAILMGIAIVASMLAYQLRKSSVTSFVDTNSPGTTEPTVKTTSVKTYTNDQYGFAFQYQNDYVVSNPSINEVTGRAEVTFAPHNGAFQITVEAGKFTIYNVIDGALVFKRNLTLQEAADRGVSSTLFDSITRQERTIGGKNGIEVSGIEKKSGKKTVAVYIPIDETNNILVMRYYGEAKSDTPELEKVFNTITFNQHQ